MNLYEKIWFKNLSIQLQCCNICKLRTTVQNIIYFTDIFKHFFLYFKCTYLHTNLYKIKNY